MYSRALLSAVTPKAARSSMFLTLYAFSNSNVPPAAVAPHTRANSPSGLSPTVPSWPFRYDIFILGSITLHS